MNQAGPPVAIRTVAVIGAGTAGRGFALACAAAGLDVILEDVMPAKLRRAEVEYAELMQQARAGRLELALTVEDAVRGADIAVDFVPDELESKLEIFSMIDRMAPPKTILCTPTDALSISDLASCVYRPERCVALRGTMLRGGAVRLVYPVGVAEEVLARVELLLGKLGMGVERQADPQVPMLGKNAVLQDGPPARRAVTS